VPWRGRPEEYLSVTPNSKGATYWQESALAETQKGPRPMKPKATPAKPGPLVRSLRRQGVQGPWSRGRLCTRCDNP